MTNITAKQQMVLDYIKGHIRTEGYSPTVSKIADYFGWSSANAAQEHLIRLTAKGFLKKTPRGYLPIDVKVAARL